MRVDKDDLLESIKLQYNILRDETDLLERRINTLVSICGALIVLVSGLLAFLSKKIDSIMFLLSKILFSTFVFLSALTILLAIITLYPRTARSQRIKDEDYKIKWGEEEDIGKFKDYANYWLGAGGYEDYCIFLKETFIKSLWAKENLKKKRIKLFRRMSIIFIFAVICLSVGSLVIILSY